MNVDAVQERPRQFRLVFLRAFGHAAAGLRRVAQKPAAAGIHRRNELEARGIANMGIGARNHGGTRFDGLTQRIQNGAREFRQLVQEEHAQMREADLAGFDFQPAADERGHRGRMMRAPEWARARNRAVLELAGETVDHGNFERLARIQRRQQSRQPARQHRLARARRSDHEHVVTAGRGDLERALDGFLALDVLQIGNRNRAEGEPRLWRAQDLRAFHVIDERDQRRSGKDLEFAGPGRFRAACGGTDEAAARSRRGDGGRQHTGDRGDVAIERELSHRGVAGHLVRRQHAHGGQEPERNRHIVMAAFLGQVGGCQVDGDALPGKRQPDRVQRRAHALLGFAHGLVGEADDVELAAGAGAWADVNLHVDFARFDALEGDRVDMGDGHKPPSRPWAQSRARNGRADKERPRTEGARPNPTQPSRFIRRKCGGRRISSFD